MKGLAFLLRKNAPQGSRMSDGHLLCAGRSGTETGLWRMLPEPENILKSESLYGACTEKGKQNEKNKRTDISRG